MTSTVYSMSEVRLIRRLRLDRIRNRACSALVVLAFVIAPRSEVKR